MAPVANTQLSSEDLADSQMATVLAANAQKMTADSTTLTNTLAMPGTGGTVAVYATANESYTTVDTSSGSSVSISGNGRNDFLFTFTNPGSSPAISGYIDADAAFAPTAASDGQTAFSDVLDGPAIAAANSGAPASLGTDSTGSFTGGTETVSVPASRCFGANPCDQGNAATWAINHDYPGTNKGENGFGDDCTDFVSRALNKGGHFQQYWQGSALLPSTKHNLNYWYQYHYYVGGVFGPYAATSRTWARAISLATFEKHYGAYFYKYEKTQTNVSSNIRVGAVIFAAIAKGSTQWGKIDHTGIVTAVSGRNLYITQHTKNYTNMPLWAAAGRRAGSTMSTA